ncbi:hypothetical protein ASD48_09755 [Streptomyces sp. Root1310]|nr:hypothetical protein ASD48_09755 [Streptomyces sp. Root1310]
MRPAVSTGDGGAFFMSGDGEKAGGRTTAFAIAVDREGRRRLLGARPAGGEAGGEAGYLR